MLKDTLLIPHSISINHFFILLVNVVNDLMAVKIYLSCGIVDWDSDCTYMYGPTRVCRTLFTRCIVDCLFI